MPDEMVVNTPAPICVTAAGKYAAEVTRQTAFAIKVSEVADGVDVEFGDAGPSPTALRVRWSYQQPGISDVPGEWDVAADEGEGYDVPRQAMQHYTRTLEALARNVEAAQAFLQL